MMHHQGLTDLTGASFTPLGSVNFDAAAIQVRPIHRTRTSPICCRRSGRTPASSTRQARPKVASGTSRLAGLLDEQRIPPASVVWVPSNGSAPRDARSRRRRHRHRVAGSHPEGRSLIDAGKVKSLAVLDETPVDAVSDRFRPAEQAIGSNWTMGVVAGHRPRRRICRQRSRRGCRLPSRRPTTATEYREFMTNRGFGMRWADPAEFAADDVRLRHADGRGDEGRRARRNETRMTLNHTLSSRADPIAGSAIVVDSRHRFPRCPARPSVRQRLPDADRRRALTLLRRCSDRLRD